VAAAALIGELAMSAANTHMTRLSLLRGLYWDAIHAPQRLPREFALMAAEFAELCAPNADASRPGGTDADDSFRRVWRDLETFLLRCYDESDGQLAIAIDAFVERSQLIHDRLLARRRVTAPAGQARPSADAELQSQQRAMELLLANLTEEQRRQYIDSWYFDVIGGDSGKRYRITHGCQHNVFALERGLRTLRLCFLPRGCFTIGDVMLAQKIALELFETEALKIANTESLRRVDRGGADTTLSYPEREFSPEGQALID
jgi:hypothetical protein